MTKNLGVAMSVIYFSKNGDRKKFVNQVLETFSSSIECARSVFIKPNIVSYEGYPTTTNPEVLESILTWCSGKTVVVGDAPAIDAGRSSKILEKSPLRKVCDAFGVELLNLYSAKMKTITSPRGYKVTVSAVPLGFDFVISIPVLKIHGMVGLSGALKNQFGYLNRKERLFMHCKLKNIDKGIAEVNAAVPTNLFIVDGVETMIRAQECRHGGCKAQLNALMAGVDPVSLDVFGLQLLRQVEPRFERKKNQAWRYIEYAASCGVGNKDFEVKNLD